MWTFNFLLQFFQSNNGAKWKGYSVIAKSLLLERGLLTAIVGKVLERLQLEILFDL